jgi:hypothetical protein
LFGKSSDFGKGNVGEVGSEATYHNSFIEVRYARPRQPRPDAPGVFHFALGKEVTGVRRMGYPGVEGPCYLGVTTPAVNRLGASEQ